MDFEPLMWRMFSLVNCFTVEVGPLLFLSRWKHSWVFFEDQDSILSFLQCKWGYSGYQKLKCSLDVRNQTTKLAPPRSAVKPLAYHTLYCHSSYTVVTFDLIILQPHYWRRLQTIRSRHLLRAHVQFYYCSWKDLREGNLCMHPHILSTCFLTTMLSSRRPKQSMDKKILDMQTAGNFRNVKRSTFEPVLFGTRGTCTSGSGLIADREFTLPIRWYTTLLAETIPLFACRSRFIVVSAASTAATPACAKRFTQAGSFCTPSRSQKASQKWLQFLERRS